MATQEEIGTTTIEDDRMTIHTKCHYCRGTGISRQRVYIQNLKDIYSTHPENKIQRIKEVRSAWNLGLKSAKELVETFDSHMEMTREIEKSYSTEITNATDKLFGKLAALTYE